PRPRYRRRAGRAAHGCVVRRQPRAAAGLLHGRGAADCAAGRRAAPARRRDGRRLRPRSPPACYFFPALPAPIPGANGVGTGPPFFFLFLSCFGFFFSLLLRICPLAMTFLLHCGTARRRPRLATDQSACAGLSSSVIRIVKRSPFRFAGYSG